MNREMHIYVVTRGRPQIEHQHTLRNLPLKWLARTTIVCHENDRQRLEFDWLRDPARPDYRVQGIVAPPTKNITEKRKWIFEHTRYEKILMLDDDLRFHVRRDPKNSTKLSLPFGPGVNDAKSIRMFDALEKKLDTYRHGGISGRFMNNTVKSEWKYTCKVLHALSWHVPTVLKHCKLDRVMCGVEHDLTLQLFEAGFPNAVYFWGTQEEPAGRAAPGGTSFYRTAELIWDSARKMEKLHPGIVRIANPEAGIARGKSRVVQLPKVRIGWRKALKQGS